MQWVDSSYQLIKPEWGVEEMFKNIERAGRICYASEPKEGVTARQFTERLIKSNHLSPLEFGICYLHYWCKKPADAEPSDSIWDTYNILTARYKNNKYSTFHAYEGKTFLQIDITTNYRVLVENGWTEDLQYMSEPTKNHSIYYTVIFTCSEGVAREFCRHRLSAHAQQSTRYCNFSKDKFGNEITFINPEWFKKPGMAAARNALKGKCAELEYLYMDMIGRNMLPQEAREILPLCTKTVTAMCTSFNDWNHFFELRALGSTGAPHPDAKALAMPLMEEMTAMHSQIWDQITMI